jgi:hypothetical protein
MKDVSTKQVNVGMNSDVNPKFLKEGYRFALNSVLMTEDGQIFSNSNEAGNTVVATLPTSFQLIGTCLTNDEKIVVFSTDDVISEIGYFNPDIETYTTLIRSSCLGLSTKYPVSCLFSIKNGCESVIYFTDKFNKYRSINLSKLTDYTSESSAADANTSDNWECDQFNLSPNYAIPLIELESVNDFGGNLKVGSYQFAIQYLDNNNNPSSWFYVTNPVPIVDEPLNGNYFDINGGTPIFNSAEPEEGSVPTTSKSITLRISNLDTNYPNFRIAGLHSTSTVSKVSEVWYSEAQSIVADEQVYTYTGPNLDTDVRGSLAEIIIDNTPIHVAKAHAQVDQSLWLANLEGARYDYAAFQRKASLIRSNFVSKAVQVTNILNPGDPKNPFTWWNTRSFMPDEIYAFGIQYLFADGSWSPVFHIPGRAASNNELALEATSDNSLHLGTGEFPVWRIHNTSDGTNFAYHETLQTNYPNNTDCNGESIWGYDADGNTLQDARIRHHKFPDRRVVPIYDQDSDSINIMGIQFTDVEYPDDAIIGHRFVMARRTDDNKTVLDNGIIFTPNVNEVEDNSTYYDTLSVLGNSHNSLVFTSPKTLVEKRYFNSTHFRVHSKVVLEDSVLSEGTVDDPAYNSEMRVHTYTLGTENYQVPVTENVQTDASIYVAPRTSQSAIGNFEFPLLNKSFSNAAYFFHNPNPVEEVGLTLASVKNNGDPYKTLSLLTYFPIHNSYITETDEPEIYGGDSFVTNLNYFNTYDVDIQGETPGLFGNIEDGQIQTADANYISGVWLDSEINIALRHGGSSRCNNILHSNDILWRYLRNKLYDPDPETVNPITGQPSVNTKYRQRSDFCLEYYGYNKDYSKVQEEKGGQALSYTFDYCSECLNSFPYRIRVSQRSYQEDSRDNYRVFKDGDRTDLPGVSGPITSLRVYNDNLYAIAKRDIYFVPINPQTLQTSEALTYLGTGERLSIPPRRLSSAQYPYGGSMHDFSTIVTEFGIVYVDYMSKKVFLMQGDKGLQDISSLGLKMFFQNNMEFELDKQYKELFGIAYPFLDNTTYEYGLGFTVAYDPYLQRLILSKKDYSLSETGLANFKAEIAPGNINWLADKFILQTKGFTSVPLEFSDSRYFKNNSWTLSFFLPQNVWASYHSYLPNILFNDSYHMYSVTGTNQIWKHKEGNYQTFYDTKYDYVLDLVMTSNPTVASTFNVFDVNCNAALDSDTDDYFFDRAVIYNSYQSSGLLPITIKANSFSPTISDGLIASRAERNWRLSDFRDNVTDYSVPIFSNNWLDLANDYYIDKVPNSAATSTSKSPFEQARFRDHFIGCRLYFNPTENIKLTTDLVSSINKISFR